jgi:hypothetical protein
LVKTTFAENIFGVEAALEQLVDEIVWYWHSVVPFNRLVRMPLTQIFYRLRRHDASLFLLDANQGKGFSHIDAVAIAPSLPFKISNIKS